VVATGLHRNAATQRERTQTGTGTSRTGMAEVDPWRGATTHVVDAIAATRLRVNPDLDQQAARFWLAADHRGQTKDPRYGERQIDGRGARTNRRIARPERLCRQLDDAILDHPSGITAVVIREDGTRRRRSPRGRRHQHRDLQEALRRNGDAAIEVGTN